MKIARIITPQGTTATVTENNGRLERMEGCVYEGLKTTGETVEAASWLPPVDPAMLICIGLNYRKHAVECNLPIPEQPVVFMKNIECAVGHQTPILVPQGNRNMRFNIPLVYARRPKLAFDHNIGGRESLLHIPLLKMDMLSDVARPRRFFAERLGEEVFMQQRRRLLHGVEHPGDGRQRFILNPNLPRRLLGQMRVNRCDAGDRMATVKNFVPC